MIEVTDDMMKEFLSKVKPYTLMILHKTSKFKTPDVSAIVWEHGRRNMQFRLKGKMNITCPVHDETDPWELLSFQRTLKKQKELWTRIQALRQEYLPMNFKLPKLHLDLRLSKIQNCAQFFFFTLLNTHSCSIAC